MTGITSLHTHHCALVIQFLNQVRHLPYLRRTLLIFLYSGRDCATMTSAPLTTKSISSVRRLHHDYRLLQKDPIPLIVARPNPNNIHEWHYVLEGPADSDFEGGVYHGKLVFPESYPFAPPAIYIFTPNGRFVPNQRLCLSMSDYHPESWNPAWSVGTILTGLLSFLLEIDSQTVGSVSGQTTPEDRQLLARYSLEHNIRNSPIFVMLFPDIIQKYNALKNDAEVRNTLEDVRHDSCDNLSKDSTNGGIMTAANEMQLIPHPGVQLKAQQGFITIIQRKLSALGHTLSPLSPFISTLASISIAFLAVIVFAWIVS